MNADYLPFHKIEMLYILVHMQELRKQLENQVVTIDSLQNENRAVAERKENVHSAHSL